MSRFIIGVDLGKTHDYTAIHAIEVKGEGSERTYESRHLERLQIGTAYTEQVARVAELYKRLLGPELAPDPDLELMSKTGGIPEDVLASLPTRPTVELVVDQTGVGQAVVDMMRGQGLPAVAVSITAGGAVTKVDSRTFRVPKNDLVDTLQVVMQTDRLRIPGTSPLAGQFKSEMQAFKRSVNERGNASYGNDWRENPHDDLVLATMLAVWYGETGVPFNAFVL